jgi:hypothetical protein
MLLWDYYGAQVGPIVSRAPAIWRWVGVLPYLLEQAGSCARVWYTGDKAGQGTARSGNSSMAADLSAAAQNTCARSLLAHK